MMPYVIGFQIGGDSIRRLRPLALVGSDAGSAYDLDRDWAA